MAIATGSAAGQTAASGGSGGKRGSRVRDLTLTALLGVFILAVLVAVARHFLPGRLSGLVGRAMERADRR